MSKRFVTRIKSSTLFDQEKFDQKADKGVYGTHYKHVILIAFLLGLCALTLMALNSPAYKTAQSLLAHGMPASATVDDVHVDKLMGRGEKFITTVSYHFRVKNELIRGSSKKNSSQPERISKGDVVEVLYDPSQPIVNGWRAALHRETAGAFGVILASAFIAPYCAMSTYRYVRWVWRRRRSPLAEEQDHLGRN